MIAIFSANSSERCGFLEYNTRNLEYNTRKCRYLEGRQRLRAFIKIINNRDGDPDQPFELEIRYYRLFLPDFPDFMHLDNNDPEIFLFFNSPFISNLKAIYNSN